MKLSRPPKPALQPFIELLWASDGADEASPPPTRELVLPTGAVHVAIRLKLLCAAREPHPRQGDSRSQRFR